jgi:type II secretory pathway pseudopilin PulG
MHSTRTPPLKKGIAAQKGYSIVEVGISLALIGSLLSAVYIGANTLRTSSMAQDTASALLGTISNTQSYFRNFNSFNGLTEAVMCQAQMVNPPLTCVTNQIHIPWESSNNALIVGTNNALLSGFSVGTTDVVMNRSVCTTIANTLLPVVNSMHIGAAAAVNATTAVVSGGTTIKTNGTPVATAAADIATACSGATPVIAVNFPLF